MSWTAGLCGVGVGLCGDDAGLCGVGADWLCGVGAVWLFGVAVWLFGVGARLCGDDVWLCGVDARLCDVGGAGGLVLFGCLVLWGWGGLFALLIFVPGAAGYADLATHF